MLVHIFHYDAVYSKIITKSSFGTKEKGDISIPPWSYFFFECLATSAALYDLSIAVLRAAILESCDLIASAIFAVSSFFIYSS
jgi:hypothetical protein